MTAAAPARGVGVGPASADEGTVSAMVSVLALAILLSVALVVDGGRRLGGLSEARDIADNAARRGSQSIDLEAWRATGRPVVDPVRAQASIADFMARSGLDERVRSWEVVPTPGPDGDISVTVEVTIEPDRFLLPTGPVRAVETATALDAVTVP
jgi:hypothetical protein